MLLQALCIFLYPLVNSNLSYSPETPKSGSNWMIFRAVRPCKTIGHLFYATSSFVHHFVAIGEFKLQLQSGNALSGQIRRFLEPCDLEIWRMTLQNNRAPLLCYFKLSTSFRSHWWIQTWVTVRKRPIWVKFCDFSAVWPWNLTDDLQKQ